MIVIREIGNRILENCRKYPVISITGPRQSGKTTLARSLFPTHPYVNLERPDYREQALEDPNRFLGFYKDGVILDEVQRVPDLFSSIQAIVDESQKPGQFILTGSQNFLLLERISQSLAGRVSIFRLLPFSLSELQSSAYAPTDLDTFLFNGTYPPVYDRGYEPHGWYMDYIQTYIERDVRTLRNISDLSLFQRFVGLCAGRTGQLLNLNSLAGECGVSHNTARDWMSVLEASYLVFRLPPYHENLSKRIVKQNKLYFYDSGLLCALLGLHDPKQLRSHYLRGAIFESFVVSEFVKARWTGGDSGVGYFWRDRHGNEVDYLFDSAHRVVPVEIKSGETIRAELFKGLDFWRRLGAGSVGWLVYGGNENQDRKAGRVIGWSSLPAVLKGGEDPSHQKSSG